MLPEAALLFDAPGFVHRARDRTEEAERRPDESKSSRHTDAKPVGSKRVELIGQEIEPRRKVSEHEPQHAGAVRLIGRDGAQYGDR